MKNKIIVGKIINYINKITEYTSGSDYNSFISNPMLVEACVFNLSQIGEIANKIDSDFEKEHISIPWRVLYGLRNKIVHDYEGVNFVLIWDIISMDLPLLKISLEELYRSL